MSATGTDLPPDEGGPDDGPGDGDDILAAEFALGVLPPAEQAALALRMDTDPAFARRVTGWQDRLLPLADGFAATPLPPAVKRALDRRLFGAAPEAAPERGLWRSLALWRGLAAGATLAFLLAVALPWRAPPDPDTRLIASLTPAASDVHYMAVYDPGDGAVGLSHLSGNPDAGRDFELWVIAPDRPPVSLGVIPAGAATAHLSLDAPTRALIAAGAQLAISLEPQGGSATGLPTGVVVAAGDLRGI